MTVKGHNKDVQMDESGAVIEVEEQVALETLPTEVRAGVESISKKNRLVAYEA